MINDIEVTTHILKSYHEKLMACRDLDVAIVGGGPSGLVAASKLASDGFNTAVFEAKLAPGGGMWGGGMMFNEIVVQKEAVHILDEFGINYREREKGYFTADSVESTSALINSAVSSGARIFNLIKVVDVVLYERGVSGIVINWTPVEYMNLHVDPLTIGAKKVLDATGHPAELTNTLVKKAGVTLNTPSGRFEGEKPMNAEKGEKETVKNTSEVFSNFYVSGMAANGVYGGFRMGPIFGGMLLSGQKVYEMIKEALSTE
ncbi:MAG: sulfide-dependent adenosine diphosphate thiazole synthase [bacterium]